MENNISGMYKLTVNNTFRVNGNEWQIRNKGTRQYIIDNTTDTYVSGLFQVKGYEDEFSSFDYAGGYYLLSIEDGYAYIQFVNEKLK